MEEIILTKPTLYSVQVPAGQFETSTVTYSSATDTYNSGLYGGAVPQQVKGSVLYNIYPLSPSLTYIEEATGEFGENNTQYSSSTDTYNDGTYGGQSPTQVRGSVLYSIDNAKPVIYRIDKI